MGCGDDDGAENRPDSSVTAPESGASDAGAIDDATVARDAEPMDAEPDAGVVEDAGGDDAGERDTGTSPSDGGGQPVDPVTGLPGVWEVTGIEDSGGPFEAAPPGMFLVFDGSRVRLGCADGMGLAYELRPGPGAFTTVHVEIGGGSTVDWVIVELTTTTFVFSEGGDRFFHERREACP